MQEEIENRTVNLAISTTRLTANTLIAGFKKYMHHRANVKAQNANEKPVGKQSIKELIGQNQGVSSIDIAKTDIRGFEKYARSYGVDYAIVKDKTGEIPKYVCFFKARDADALTSAFNAYTADVLKSKEKPSVLKQLSKLKEIVAALPANAVIRDIKKKISLLFDWIAEAKAELAKPQAPDLVSLLNAYYTQRKAGAYSQKGKISNLKEMNETFNYLRANGIYTLEDLESRVNEHSSTTESLKKTLDGQTARMKAIKQLSDSSATFQSLKPVYDGLQKIKFEKPRAKYKAEHEAELKQFYAARRKLTGEFPDGKVDMKKLSAEYDALEQAHDITYGEFKTVRDDLHRLWKVKSCVDTAARFNEHTEQEKLQNRPQTRHKKEELSR